MQLGREVDSGELGPVRSPDSGESRLRKKTFDSGELEKPREEYVSTTPESWRITRRSYTPESSSDSGELASSTPESPGPNAIHTVKFTSDEPVK